jgi:hypothetical protein
MQIVDEGQRNSQQNNAEEQNTLFPNSLTRGAWSRTGTWRRLWPCTSTVPEHP